MVQWCCMQFGNAVMQRDYICLYYTFAHYTVTHVHTVVFKVVNVVYNNIPMHH